MGLFDYFKRRRERESAVASLEVTAEPSSHVAPRAPAAAPGEAAAGERAEGVQAAGVDFAQLGQIGQMIFRAAKEGSIQVQVSEPQSIDLGDGGLREEILAIIGRHGIDPDAQTAEGIDASAMPQMQQEILDAIARQGVDLSAHLGGGDADGGGGP